MPTDDHEFYTPVTGPFEEQHHAVATLAAAATAHDHAGYSEEKCVRCGWVMGHPPLNCQNDNTPHVFPSQRSVLPHTVNPLDANEHALVLFSRMLSRRPVWIDSPANQMEWVQMIGLDEDGKVVVYDTEGNDRRAEDYMLTPRAGGST